MHRRLWPLVYLARIHNIIQQRAGPKRAVYYNSIIHIISLKYGGKKDQSARTDVGKDRRK